MNNLVLTEQLSDANIGELRTFVSCVGGNKRQFNNSLITLAEETTLMLGFE